MGDERISSDGIVPVDLQVALEERYLSYALSTIMHRALPDVRDGLKPVHRRLLYAMRILRLNPTEGFKKSARVVGDVIGKFHPHGEQAVYDALVRLAQNFAVRYPLVDGQGNFGNIDGDNAAAMRYTESRLTEVARLLLDGLDEDAVDFRETYDGEEREPLVLPGAFPNLLANGSAGIAVGMATNIPPHNVAELCDAALHLVKYPNAGIEKLVEFVPGPDFPTGGILVESRSAIIEAYKSGRGGFRVRSRWQREELGRGAWQIIVTEIPYQVQKSRLIEKVAELLLARKLPLLGDIRDESAEDVRIVLEPRARNVEAELLMESLFKLTDFETRISLNMNVISRGQVPNVLGLAEILREWLDHRREVLQRRSRFRLEKIAHRLEVLEGYLKAYLNLDEVIRIIREEDEAKPELMAAFALTDVQAEAILNMRLRSLRKLEEMEIRSEHQSLSDEQKELRALLASDEAQWTTIAGQIREVRKSFSSKTELGARRTDFGEVPDKDFDSVIQQAMIEREPITVILSQKGWVRAMKGHTGDFKDMKFKEGDSLQLAVIGETTDKFLAVTARGRVFTLAGDKFPGGRGHGEPVRILMDMEEDDQIIAFFVHKPEQKCLVATSNGYGFIVPQDGLLSSTRKGRQVVNVTADAEVVLWVPAVGDRVAVIGQNRKLLIFPLEQLPEMSRGKGVRLQRYKGGGISDAICFKADDGLTWQDSAGRSYTRSMDELREWQGDRAQAGRLPPSGFPKSNKFGIVQIGLTSSS